MRKSLTKFSVYVMVKAWETNDERKQVLEILRAAYHEGRLPEVSQRPTSGQLARFFALVPPELKKEAGRLLKTFMKFVREERAAMEWRRAHPPVKSSSKPKTSRLRVPRKAVARETWPWLTQKLDLLK